MATIDELFKQLFPKLAENNKLKDFQKKAASNVIKGNNTLCIMPTGGGKSWIYWLSGAALHGITIVISPLIALIDEQATKIQQQGYEVLTIHSGVDPRKQIELLKRFGKKELNPSFIFVSPERIATDGFFKYCITQRKEEIKLLTIDEVHCVSQWGDSFRPFYKRIPEFLNEIYTHGHWGPRILALTATLNPKEVADICNAFEISQDNIIRDDFLIRSEITLKPLKFSDENEKENKFWELLDFHKGEKTLVYLYRKYHLRGVEDLTERATSKGFKAISFHGDMSPLERQNVIDLYKNDKIDVIFATNAFGMGIDIPNIRVVIHFMIPESVEQYYQEIGRSARDKHAANAYILYTNKNVQVRKSHFIDKSFPSMEDLESCFTKITADQIGLKTVQYFEDEDIQNCFAFFLDNDLISIVCKGFSNLNMISDIRDRELKAIYDSTRTKSLISTINKTGLTAENIVNKVYHAVLNDEVELSKPFDKCLVIDSTYVSISDKIKANMNSFIQERKEYKYNLLDYFVYLLDENLSSDQLHQEIGKYLGVPKHLLNRLYATQKGDMVRSKSEVIIANLLFSNDVNYEYERKLFYTDKDWIEPDFTIRLQDGSNVYWEHLGMIGTETYDKRWKEKLEIYRRYFPDKLVVTYEGATITDSAINTLKKLSLI